ncbi:glycoside hydrolase family 31 protein [Clostridium beijerinckii]|uniref:Alpha-D-xyloside xylohydrolase n=1 Tax=Clostridium beijerinckii TaxID=1520 RepID=A0AAX0AW81_CLOBE|nr:glycoside hydrolase family 31 protein [Clostridium beijerinckii]NRT87161.1 alpha-D-xyloside xylohydrolase [Clostridium beijerinckii]NYC72592.1 alpha-D-xyloside xylohydrolase [Clostridium beijerinckii]
MESNKEINLDDSVFEVYGNVLIRKYDCETLQIEPWGKNSLRIRSTKQAEFINNDWALLPQESCEIEIKIENNEAYIENGKIHTRIDKEGKITFYNDKNDVLLEEYVRNRKNVNRFCSALEIEAREFKPILGGDYTLTMRFESNPKEKLFGMGQYQQPNLDLKNCVLELAHRNSQASVPFVLSSLGYGMLWNNPAIGKVTFGKNITEWIANSTKQLDYFITAGDTPAEIEEAYAKATGTVPMMPDYAMGFWQCKLRYQTQEELLSVAREYKKRNLPISVIVVDFFHWPKQGEWKFDLNYWPDPDAMIKELKDMGIELMVSIWPTVDKTSENYHTMLKKGYLVRVDRGIRTTMDFLGDTVFYDPTNPEARDFVWKTAKKNYYDKGIKIFWLDEAEPEYSVYDFENYRYHLGPNAQIGNIYPAMYAKTFFDGMKKEGQENIINLLRCAWAGSQRYGALVWSGDIDSSFESLRNQFAAGLNMGIAGIPWWTTDIGGFHGGNPDDQDFRECIIRWFEYGAFCPVFRLHGDREPHSKPLGTSGGGLCASGASNEVWSYGDEAYEIFKKYMLIREKMKPYIAKIMKEAHEKGTPVIRPLFYDFSEDELCWDVTDEYMFGPDVLVAPVLHKGDRSRKVYLPKGANWKGVNSGKIFNGGQVIDYNAPLEIIPLFLKDEAEVSII